MPVTFPVGLQAAPSGPQEPGLQAGPRGPFSPVGSTGGFRLSPLPQAQGAGKAPARPLQPLQVGLRRSGSGPTHLCLPPAFLHQARAGERIAAASRPRSLARRASADPPGSPLEEAACVPPARAAPPPPHMQAPAPPCQGVLAVCGLCAAVLSRC